MNPNAATFERLRTLLTEILGIDDIIRVQPYAHLVADLGADSLDAIELQLAIEETFGVEIDDDELPLLVTVGDLVERIDATVPSGLSAEAST